MKLIINGACGHMGREVLNLVEQGYMNSSLAAAVDFAALNGNVYRSLDEAPSGDVIIDFSHHTAVETLLPYACEKHIPAVICTTGHTDTELNMIRRASQQIPIFYSGNMSVGVSLLCNLAKQVAAAMPGADIEIVEIHHNRKLDAPSGTALMLAHSVQQVRPSAHINCGRTGQCKRNKDEIGINSVRMGNIIGIHEVMISTATQTITLKHEAHSRALFAEGAIAAAEFIIKQGPGMYDMQSMLSSI